MNGKIVALSLVAAGLVAGAGLYYLEQFHWYDVTEVAEGQVTLTAPDGTLASVPVRDLRVASGASSPLKYRACFTLPAPLPAATPLADAVPTVAPVSFPCFDADAIARALDAGTAQAVMGTPNVVYGIDRVIAITDAGQGYAWHQINRCGEAVFDGDPPPEGCPPPPANE